MVEAPAVAHDGSQLSPILQTATITTCRPGFFKQTTNLIEIFLIFDYLELPAQLLYGVYKDSSANTLSASPSRGKRTFFARPCLVLSVCAPLTSIPNKGKSGLRCCPSKRPPITRRWASRSRCLLV